MKEIHSRSVKFSGYKALVADVVLVNITCGSCRRSVTVPLKSLHADIKWGRYQGECPNCVTTYQVFVKYEGVRASVHEMNYNPHRVFIDPDPETLREPIVTEDQIGDGKLHRAYLNALDTFNKGAIGVVPVAVGRALEGIVKTQLRGKNVELRGRMLGQLLTQLAEEVDLSVPLHELAGALRDGRNIGAHFDDELDPSAEMAEKMVDLLEVIVEYLYVLPAQVAELKAYVSAPPEEESHPPA